MFGGAPSTAAAARSKSVRPLDMAPSTLHKDRVEEQFAGAASRSALSLVLGLVYGRHHIGMHEHLNHKYMQVATICEEIVFQHRQPFVLSNPEQAKFIVQGKQLALHSRSKAAS